MMTSLVSLDIRTRLMQALLELQRPTHAAAFIEALHIAGPVLTAADAARIKDTLVGVKHRPSQAEGLLCLLPRMDSTEQASVLAEVLTFAKDDGRSGWHWRTLSLAWPFLGPQQRRSILDHALSGSILPPGFRELLLHAASDLSAHDRQVLYMLAPALEPSYQVLVLSLIAAGLAPEFRHAAIATLRQGIETIRTWSTEECLCALPALCQLGLEHELMQLTESTTAANRIWVYLALLGPHNQTPLETARQLIVETRSIGSQRVRALVALLPHAEDAAQRDLVCTGLDICRGEPNADRRSHDLIQLIPHLPADQIAAALDISEMIRNRARRICVMAKLATHPQIAPDLRDHILRDAWRLQSRIQSPEQRALAFAALLHHEAQLFQIGTLQRSALHLQRLTTKKAA